jgi:hypothetical protein
MNIDKIFDETDNTFSLVVDGNTIKTPLESISDIIKFYNTIVLLVDKMTNKGYICEIKPYSEEIGDGGGIELTLVDVPGSVIYWFNTFKTLTKY